MTLDAILPEAIPAALRRFAEAFARVAEESPWDWDGATHWRRIAAGR